MSEKAQWQKRARRAKRAFKDAKRTRAWWGLWMATCLAMFVVGIVLTCVIAGIFGLMITGGVLGAIMGAAFCAEFTLLQDVHDARDTYEELMIDYDAWSYETAQEMLR